MRKGIYGRRLKRDTNERKALFRTLMREMVLRGQIKTTEAKTKSIKPELEKIVTKAIKSEQAAYHIGKTFNKSITDRIILEIAPKFKDRPGGYTRIVKLGNRTKDNAAMVLLEWVEKVEAVPTKIKRSQKKVIKSVGKSAVNVQKDAPKDMTKLATKAPTGARKVTQRKAMQSSKGK